MLIDMLCQDAQPNQTNEAKEMKPLGSTRGRLIEQMLVGGASVTLTAEEVREHIVPYIRDAKAPDKVRKWVARGISARGIKLPASDVCRFVAPFAYKHDYPWLRKNAPWVLDALKDARLAHTTPLEPPCTARASGWRLRDFLQVFTADPKTVARQGYTPAEMVRVPRSLLPDQLTPERWAVLAHGPRACAQEVLYTFWEGWSGARQHFVEAVEPWEFRRRSAAEQQQLEKAVGDNQKTLSKQLQQLARPGVRFAAFLRQAGYPLDRLVYRGPAESPVYARGRLLFSWSVLAEAGYSPRVSSQGDGHPLEDLDGVRLDREAVLTHLGPKAAMPYFTLEEMSRRGIVIQGLDAWQFVGSMDGLRQACYAGNSWGGLVVRSPASAFKCSAPAEDPPFNRTVPNRLFCTWQQLLVAGFTLPSATDILDSRGQALPKKI